MDKNTFHDFTWENRRMLIIGGFATMPKRTFSFTCNIVVIVCVYVVYIYLTVMALVTILLLKEVEIIVETVHTLVYLLIAFLLPILRLSNNTSLNRALRFIRGGVYNYEIKVPGDVEYNIKKKYVEQVRLITSVFTKIAVLTVISHIIIVPLIQLAILKEDTSESLLNPYLPLPIYMPYSTRTYFGFGITFLFSGIFMSFLYISASGFAQTYLSCVLQLIAELDVLCYSVKNIEKRAFLKLTKYKFGLNDSSSIVDQYGKAEFDRCIDFCLKENLSHHQCILRYKEALKPYVEAMNTIGFLFSSLLIAVALLGFMMNPGINIALIISFIAHAGSYFQMCNLGETITSKSSEIVNALYSTPWYYCDHDFKVLLNIAITTAQRPIIMKTSLLDISSSLETFANIAITGYKLINVIRA